MAGKTIMYVHGFASSAQSGTAGRLRTMLPAANVIAEDGSVGIRVTNEEFSKELCLRFRRAIVSTSANVSGQPAPQCFAEISQEIIDAVDYVVTYRQKERRKAKPSTIIKLGPTGEVKVIRK